MRSLCWSAAVIICFALADVSGYTIINGKETKAHRRPYMASLRNAKGEHICGGFLILPNYVLTAAHCYEEPIKVLLGAHDVSKKEKSWQMIPVQKFFHHKKYNNKTHENDIMLLKLKHDAKMKDEVKSISIPERYEHIKPGTRCVVAGWGRTTCNGSSSKVLREVEVVIQEKCKFASDICTRGTGTMGACNGDSGGPLICLDKIRKSKAVGIVSNRGDENCEDPNHKTVFTNVALYRDWIEGQILKSSAA
uniref:trypsin n=1 Tax=Erpetoichthys calabaricus TaxID=27687 RepID=A0A8C4TGC8_ERPCA